MHPMAKSLAAFAFAASFACGSGTGTGAQAYPTGSSVGIATLGGAASGTVPILASAQYSTTIGGPPGGAPRTLYFYFLMSAEVNSAPFGDSEFSCEGALPGTELSAGRFMEPDVGGLWCSVETGLQAGPPKLWGPVTSLDLVISSPGRVAPGGTEWAFPTGTVSVTLEPLLVDVTYGSATVSVAFGPPPGS